MLNTRRNIQYAYRILSSTGGSKQFFEPSTMASAVLGSTGSVDVKVSIHTSFVRLQVMYAHEQRD